jgi:hypothetical protein
VSTARSKACLTCHHHASPLQPPPSYLVPTTVSSHILSLHRAKSTANAIAHRHPTSFYRNHEHPHTSSHLQQAGIRWLSQRRRASTGICGQLQLRRSIDLNQLVDTSPQKIAPIGSMMLHYPLVQVSQPNPSEVLHR